MPTPAAEPGQQRARAFLIKLVTANNLLAAGGSPFPDRPGTARRSQASPHHKALPLQGQFRKATKSYPNLRVALEAHISKKKGENVALSTVTGEERRFVTESLQVLKLQRTSEF